MPPPRPWFVAVAPGPAADALEEERPLKRWWEAGFERPTVTADDPRALSSSPRPLLLTEAGARAFEAEGCRHDVDVLVLLMREARDVDAVGRWLRARGASDDGAAADAPSVADAAWLLARAANALVGCPFYKGVPFYGGI